MNPQNTHSGNEHPLHRLPRFDARALGDGVHEVWTSPEGVRLSVHVRRGKVARWSALDGQGNRIPVTTRRGGGACSEGASASGGNLLPSSGGGFEPDICFVCFRNPVPTGPRILCYEVPCS